ncbi:MAG: hypothetical protein R3B47_14405 [Bacteroidia bacterium]
MIQKTLDTGWTIDEAKALLEMYTKAQLDDKLGRYTKTFLLGESKWLLKQEPRIATATDQALTAIHTKQTSKGALLTINAVPFLHPDTFRRFVTYLPKEVQLALEDIVLDGGGFYDQIEKNMVLRPTGL